MPSESRRGEGSSVLLTPTGLAGRSTSNIHTFRAGSKYKYFPELFCIISPGADHDSATDMPWRVAEFTDKAIASFDHELRGATIRQSVNSTHHSSAGAGLVGALGVMGGEKGMLLRAGKLPLTRRPVPPGVSGVCGCGLYSALERGRME